MDEELENSTRKMQQNMNFSPEVSFQPTESQASVSFPCALRYAHMRFQIDSG